MRPKSLLLRIHQGHLANIAFSDFRRLLEALGFELARRSGSHHVFRHSEVRQRLNVQPIAGQAKPYQIRQLVVLIERYDLKLEE